MVTQLYLVMRLKIRGVILLLPLYTFMSWAGKTLLYVSGELASKIDNTKCHDVIEADRKSRRPEFVLSI